MIRENVTVLMIGQVHFVVMQSLILVNKGPEEKEVSVQIYLIKLEKMSIFSTKKRHCRSFIQSDCLILR